jgi:cyclophilin family peptidyl-prolyl cis-trans isomerase
MRVFRRRVMCLVILGLPLGLLPAGCATNDETSEPPVNKADALSGFPSGSDGGETFHVKFETTKGDFVVEVHPDWAPKGAAQIRELVEAKFYDECRFFRVVPGFMVQFGINGDPEVQVKWRDAKIEDDPVKKSNKRGFVTFATSGQNSRTAQIFINFGDNGGLDDQGFSPIGEVVEGMGVVDSINDEYKERPDQVRMQYEGNTYLKQAFPNLDYIKTARIVDGK